MSGSFCNAGELPPFLRPRDWHWTGSVCVRWGRPRMSAMINVLWRGPCRHFGAHPEVMLKAHCHFSHGGLSPCPLLFRRGIASFSAAALKSTEGNRQGEAPNLLRQSIPKRARNESDRCWGGGTAKRGYLSVCGGLLLKASSGCSISILLNKRTHTCTHTHTILRLRLRL